jgi:hypothetical protein
VENSQYRENGVEQFAITARGQTADDEILSDLPAPSESFRVTSPQLGSYCSPSANLELNRTGTSIAVLKYSAVFLAIKIYQTRLHKQPDATGV